MFFCYAYWETEDNAYRAKGATQIFHDLFTWLSDETPFPETYRYETEETIRVLWTLKSHNILLRNLYPDWSEYFRTDVAHDISNFFGEFRSLVERLNPNEQKSLILECYECAQNLQAYTPSFHKLQQPECPPLVPEKIGIIKNGWAGNRRL